MPPGIASRFFISLYLLLLHTKTAAILCKKKMFLFKLPTLPTYLTFNTENQIVM